MVQSFLITGGTDEEREKKIQSMIAEWQASPYDCLTLIPEDEKEHIGIAAVRQFEKELSLAPRTSPVTVGIIRNGELLTVPSQHALLKTLEEPPMRARIIISIDNPDMLLPTILSRMQHIQLASVETKNTDADAIQKLLTMKAYKPGNIISLVDAQFLTRQSASIWLQSALTIVEKELRTHPNTHWTNTLRAILTAQNQLSANVNHHLVMDHFFFMITLDKAIPTM